MPTHQGHVLVTTEAKNDPVWGPVQHVVVSLPDKGDVATDKTGLPGNLFVTPAPNTIVIELIANEPTFMALGADVLWYEEIPQEVI